MTQTATIGEAPGAPRRARRRAAPSGGAHPRLHLGRLAVLLLALIAASFYVGPLREFFAQQDRYQRETAALRAARAENAALKVEVERLTTKRYLAQRARLDSMLVPPDTQVFVVKGLPGPDDPDVVPRTTPQAASISVLDRIEDLWRTLLH